MNERTLLYASGVVGAVVGVAAGYLLFTGEGRALRREIASGLDDLLQHAEGLASAVDEIVRGADELTRSGTGRR